MYSLGDASMQYVHSTPRTNDPLERFSQDMRNDQIAVLLRDFAGRCIEWAAVLDKEKDDATDEDYRQLIQKHSNALWSPDPSPMQDSVPTVSGDTPPPTDGGVSSPALAMTDAKTGVMHPEPMRPLPTAYAKQELPRYDAVVDTERLPLTFRCPSCGQVRRWTSVTTPTPWPGAVCNACYAERLDREDGDR